MATKYGKKTPQGIERGIKASATRKPKRRITRRKAGPAPRSSKQNQKINQVPGKISNFKRKALQKQASNLQVIDGIALSHFAASSRSAILKADSVLMDQGFTEGRDVNGSTNKKLALDLNNIFLEVVIANGFETQALKILKKKKNLRIIDATNLVLDKKENFISNFNSILLQSSDIEKFNPKNFQIVSKIKPSLEEYKNLIFAFNVCRFVKSNAIVIASKQSTVGIGSGQPSRLDSCQIAIDKMNKFQNIGNKKIVAASDAFFPFVDGIEKLIQSGVSAVIQPSGSIKDKEIIKFANRTSTVLVFSKTRHFKH